MRVDVNFLIDNGNLRATDGSLFFGTEAARLVDKDLLMADLLAMAGIFPSKGQARKNGWDGVEIPDGFSTHQVGKLKHQVSILKPIAVSNIRFLEPVWEDK